MIQPIEKPISSTTIDGHIIARKVRFEGIQYFEYSQKHAQIIWKVFLIDTEGEYINHPDVNQGRIVLSPIVNTNRVNELGITITKEYIMSQNPQNFEEESSLEYNTRINELYNNEWNNGTPEFDFYFNSLTIYPLSIVLNQAIDLLDSLGRFDRK
jgi:hypothetical protein